MEDYKQKYEEAKFRMNKWVEGSEIIDPKEVAEFVFPELKESNDERIRKWLIEMVEEVRKANPTNSDHNGNCSDAIAWLEKQAEQKPNFCHHEVDFSDCSEEYRKAYYDGWNSCNQQHAQLEAEQKPAWSEEDEKMFSGLNSIVEDWYNTMPKKEKEYYGDCGYINWLKSLKERMKGE